MSYHFLFALTLEREGSQVFYDSKAFVDYPVIISVPEITEIIDSFITELEPVVIVEKEGESNVGAEKFVGVGSQDIEILENSNPPLRSVEGQAYICKAREIARSPLLNYLSAECKKYLTQAVSKITHGDFFSLEFNSVFAGIQEISELRNYLINFVKNPNKKKIYREGYVYIMEI
jgi:hypothetical protein